MRARVITVGVALCVACQGSEREVPKPPAKLAGGRGGDLIPVSLSGESWQDGEPFLALYAPKPRPIAGPALTTNPGGPAPATAPPTRIRQGSRGEIEPPYVRTPAVDNAERVYVGLNDFDAPDGRTATVDVSLDGGATYTSRRIEARNTAGQNGPSIRPAVAQDHTVYVRSEEHTSELQSLAYLVCRLLLEKKKKNENHNTTAQKQTQAQQEGRNDPLHASHKHPATQRSKLGHNDERQENPIQVVRHVPSSH